MTIKLKKAAAYARYSTDRQSARSIDDQFELCRKIAKQNGYEIVEYFKDEAVGGAGTLNRAGWLSLMRDVGRRDRPFDAVIIESMSRMSRDLADSARDFSRIAHREVELIDLEGPLNTMRVGMSGIMNQEFRKHLGNMLRRAWDGRVKQGLIPGKPAYGHRKVAGTSFDREIDHAQADIVNRIFTEYADGESPRVMASRLNEEGIPSPSGGLWNHNVFIAGNGNGKGILSNRIYIGELVWNQNRAVINPETEKRNKQKGKPDDLIVTNVPHLRIIDQELWDRVQARRLSRSRGAPETRMRRKTLVRHMLAGRLACGACGCHMKIVWSKPGEKTLVACSNARNRGTCNNAKSYNLCDIEETVLHGIKHNLDVEALTAFTEGAHKEWSARQKAARIDQEKVQCDLNRTVERMNRIVDILSDEDMPPAPLKEKLKALELERAGLEDRLQMAKAESGDNVVTLHPAMIHRFRENLETMVAALSDTRLSDAELAPFRVAFSNVFERVVVHPTGKRMPYEVTPYARISAIMGVDIVPKMRTPEKIMEDQGVTNLFQTTQATMSYQKQNMVGLGRWRQAA